MGARGLRHGGYLCLAQDHLRRKDGTMASTYTMVGYGSQGESVRRLQSELNKQGYQLDEDGVFGEKTRAAVRDYQKKNSLKRDGIAGDETWGSLMSASASAAGCCSGKFCKLAERHGGSVQGLHAPFAIQ